MCANIDIRKLATVWVLAAAAFFAGCATVPMESKEQDAAAKAFTVPAGEISGIYIFRDSTFGALVKKLVSLDGKPLGQSAPMTYFYKVIAPGKHTITTESEFGDNHLDVVAEEGKLLFIRNYIRMGVFIGGANLEVVSEVEGKKGVLECSRAASFSQ